LVFGLTYFYVFLQFNPEKIAEDIKRKRGFIPGIRPGKATSAYLHDITSKITIFGGLFLSLIAVLPYILYLVFGPSVNAFAVGGTGLLIVVSVALETLRQAKAMTTKKNYSNFLD
jgi:preprotein translocase subunit SecY